MWEATLGRAEVAEVMVGTAATAAWFPAGAVPVRTECMGCTAVLHPAGAMGMTITT